MFFPYPLRNGQTLSEWSIEHLASTSDEAKFLAFLSLYGSRGVLLGDLLTFATLRDSIKPLESHWLLSGEVGPILRPLGASSLPTHCSFLSAFVRATHDSESFLSLENRLKSLGLIWVIDSLSYPRIWCVAKNQMSSHLMVSNWHDLEGENIIMDLLYVFTEMPSKDVSLLAEGHREAFYTHARIFALKTLRFSKTILKDAREYTTALILKVLTHRSHNGDEKLFQLAKACPSSTNGSDWTIMMLWAELKKITYSGDLRIETGLNLRIMRRLSWKGKRQNRANGLTGFLLVEWLKAAEPIQDSKLNRQIFNYAMEWVERAWYSGSSIEHAALCCVLANFRMLDRSVLVPTKYHYLYGYYLSRASHLEQAEEFLTSGLQLSNPTLGWWGYQFELVSVLIRLGRRQEAQEWLTKIKEHTKLLNDDSRETYVWSRDWLNGDAEIRMLSGLYDAEFLMAAGEVSRAGSQLEGAIEIGNPMATRNSRGREDGYIRSLLLAFQMRLLEVRIWEGSPKRALKVANKVIEVRGQFDLGLDTVQWITQELLTLSNVLVCAGNVSAASSLLENIFKIFPYHHCSDSLKDLLHYAEKRRGTVRNLPISDQAEKDHTAAGHESKAITKQALQLLDRPRSENDVSLPQTAVSDSADMVARVPHNNPPAAVSKSRDDPWRPMSETSSGLRIEIKSNAQDLLNRRGSMGEYKNLDTAMNRLTEKAPLAKPTAPSKISRRGLGTKKLMQWDLRSSVAAMLRQAPRAPITEPAVQSGEKERAPVQTDFLAEHVRARNIRYL